jgi:hypothetical protein
VLFIGKLPRVDRRDDDWAGGVRDNELAASNVNVDTERVLFDLLGYGEGKDAEQHAWSRLSAETRGVRERSLPLGRDMFEGGRVNPRRRGHVGHCLLVR